MENLISIVVPAHNEEKNLGEFIGQAAAAVKKITNDFEIIIVDDGSTDGSLAVLKQQKVKFTHLKIIRMRRRCGQTAAIMAGFELAKGKIVVVLDADLQQDPADIAKLIKPIIDDQAEVVSGRRQKRKHSIFIKLIIRFSALVCLPEGIYLLMEYKTFLLLCFCRPR